VVFVKSSSSSSSSAWRATRMSFDSTRRRRRVRDDARLRLIDARFARSFVFDVGKGGTQKEFFFAGIDGVKFRRPVVPGDTLVMKVVLTKLNKRFGIAKMKGQCFVGDDLACEAELTLALGS